MEPILCLRRSHLPTVRPLCLSLNILYNFLSYLTAGQCGYFFLAFFGPKPSQTLCGIDKNGAWCSPLVPEGKAEKPSLIGQVSSRKTRSPKPKSGETCFVSLMGFPKAIQSDFSMSLRASGWRGGPPRADAFGYSFLYNSWRQ